MSRFLILFSFIFISFFAEARLCRDVFHTPYGININPRSKQLIDHLNLHNFANVATMVIPAHRNNKVTYRAELVDGGVIIKRTSEGDYFLNQNGIVERPIEGAITIASHSRIPGLFVVGKFDGTIDYVSFDVPHRIINNPTLRTSLAQAMRSRNNDELIQWMENRDRFIPDDRMFELIGMIDAYPTLSSLYKAPRIDSFGELRPVRELDIEALSTHINSESVLSVFVGITGRVFVNRHGHLYPKLINE